MARNAVYIGTLTSFFRVCKRYLDEVDFLSCLNEENRREGINQEKQTTEDQANNVHSSKRSDMQLQRIQVGEDPRLTAR